VAGPFWGCIGVEIPSEELWVAFSQGHRNRHEASGKLSGVAACSLKGGSVTVGLPQALDHSCCQGCLLCHCIQSAWCWGGWGRVEAGEEEDEDSTLGRWMDSWGLEREARREAQREEWEEKRVVAETGCWEADTKSRRTQGSRAARACGARLRLRLELEAGREGGGAGCPGGVGAGWG